MADQARQDVLRDLSRSYRHDVLNTCVHDVSRPLELEMINQDIRCGFVSGVIYSRGL